MCLLPSFCSTFTSSLLLCHVAEELALSSIWVFSWVNILSWCAIPLLANLWDDRDRVEVFFALALTSGLWYASVRR